jgi:LysM repeat protein
MLLVKLIGFIGKVLKAFFVWVVFKPIFFILKFFLYRPILKIYSSYLRINRYLKLKESGNNKLITWLQKKSLHIFVVVLTVIIVITNFANKGKAEVTTEKLKKTVIANVITNEFSDIANEELITESAVQEGAIINNQSRYLHNAILAENIKKINTKTEPAVENSNLETTSDGQAVLKPNIATTNKTIPTRTDVVNYTILTGDTISSIAEKFNISVNTILWENNLSAYSTIKPGQNISILPTSGIRHTVKSGENLSSISKKYDIDANAIAKANNISLTTSLKINQKLMIPGGKKITTAVTTVKKTGISTIKNIVKPSTQVASGSMFWPTEGHRITQYYSWRHTGLDIANKTGTPLYAAEGGTVTFSGWSSGYGNRVDIDHGNGKKTRYGHASKLYVSVGDVVEKGQAIAAMGSTGRSTGPHLHFEVLINGVRQNPLNYIK